jgi:SAM-dependent methyltransferase
MLSNVSRRPALAGSNRTQEAGADRRSSRVSNRSNRLRAPKRGQRTGAVACVPSAAEFFDSRAAVYDEAYETVGSGGHTLRARLAVTLALVGSGPGEALDVGMGPGRLCLELARRGFTVSGIDSSQAMVELARKRIGHIAASLLRADLDELPFPDSSFDVVTATGVMEYVQDRPAALREISRVLRPGGRAVVSVPNPVALYARVYGPHMRAVKTAQRLAYGLPRARPRGGVPIRRNDFQGLLADAGLRTETVRYAGFLLIPLPLDAAMPKLAGRLAARLESRRPRLGAMLATQVVFAARR